MKSFSSECSGQRSSTSNKSGGKMKTYHEDCTYSGCVCLCHKSKHAGLMHKTEREDFLFDYTVVCLDCEIEGKFVHNNMGVHASRFLGKQGWINLSGTAGMQKGGSKGRWTCPDCSIERLDTVDVFA